MESLPEQLKRLEKLLKERPPSNATSHMQQHGSTSAAGKPLPPMESLPPETTIKAPGTVPLAEKMAFVLGNAVNGSLKEIDSPPPIEPAHSDEDKAKLAEALSRICVLQRQYGKTTAELSILVEGFCWALEAYPMRAILAVIKQFVLREPQIPTPADIEKILNPPLPKPDWPLYIELKKRLREGRIFVTDEEKKFVRNCENLALLRQQGEMENYQDAQLQLNKWGDIMN